MSAEVLRRAAALMREEHATQGAWEPCLCEESDSWFDRSICPEPCGSMHNVCRECARIQGHCAVAVEDRKNGDRLAASWLVVADWLAATVTTDANAPYAVAAARAYLGESS